MSAARRNVPAPNMDGTDPNQVLRSRVNVFDVKVGNGTSAEQPPAPAHTTPPPAHTPPMERVRTKTAGSRQGGTRPDPDGMKRISLYVTQDAATALEQAADSVLATLGGDVPRHVALSALLEAAAKQAPAIAQELVQQRAAELADRLKALHDQQNST